jgi:hypothetical protein
MSYETTLFLLAEPGRGKAKSLRSALQREQTGKGATDPKSEVNFLLRHIEFSSCDSLEFRPNKRHGVDSDECPDDEGLVLSVWGGWHEPEGLALWLCQHGAEGSVVLHSREGDADAWGWEFENRRIRRLQLSPASRWRRLGPPASKKPRKPQDRPRRNS